MVAGLCMVGAHPEEPTKDIKRRTERSHSSYYLKGEHQNKNGAYVVICARIESMTFYFVPGFSFICLW